MGKPWHEANPSLLREIRDGLAHHYSTLHLHESSSGVVVRGTFPVESDGKVLERFHVEIVFPPHYPKGIPDVIETRSRIPRKDDRHMGATGVACLFVPEEYRLKYPKGQPFLDFLRGPVRDYFLAQLEFERSGKWPFGQRSHREAGRLEFYQELLGVPDSRVIRKYLACIAVKDLKGHLSCPCGSGKRVRDCHWSDLQKLRAKIPRRFAQEGLAAI